MPAPTAGEGIHAAYARAVWRQRLLSLWAPVTVLGAVLLAYIALVEWRTETYHWAQGVMRGVGLVMVAWFAVLAVVPWVLPGFRRQKRARHAAHELVGEVQGLLGRYGGKLEARARDRVAEQLTAVQRAYVAPDAAALEDEAGKLGELTEKHLKTWRKNSGLDYALGFGKALAVALLIRAVLIEPFKIPSGSMIPTLEIGDQIFVNKFIYGVRIPWMNKVPFVLVREPQRGDVIVFNNPTDESKDFIKRVIGVPGDRIKIVGATLFINGAPQARRLVEPRYVYYDDQERGRGWEKAEELLYEENLDGHLHPTLQAPQTCQDRVEDDVIGHCTFMQGKEFVVPERAVFVMGDHRDHSSDGRYGLGRSAYPDLVFVPYGHIKGKAMVIWLSLAHDGLLSGLFDGTGLRVDRLFLPVR